jgi:tetratricopeptide (TPR) repeat protein
MPNTPEVIVPPSASSDAADTALQPAPPSGRAESRWSLLANQYTVISGVVAVVVSVGAFWVSTKGYLDRKVEMEVNKRLDVYQNLASGLNFNQSDEYESALATFHAAINDPRFGSSSIDTQNLVRDGLLYAVVNSDRPLKNGGDVAAIELRFGREYPESSWRQQQLGWYYMRVGHLDKAREHFDRALQLYNLSREYRAGGDALRGLMFVRAATGDLSGARAAAEEAKQRNPSLFPTTLPAELASLQHEDWYLQMESLYGERFKSTMNLLLKP